MLEVRATWESVGGREGTRLGRLIRRRDDRGIVAILDGRIVTRGYGRTFVDTLPTGLPRTSSIEQVRRWWNVPAAAVAAAVTVTATATVAE